MTLEHFLFSSIIHRFSSVQRWFTDLMLKNVPFENKFYTLEKNHRSIFATKWKFVDRIRTKQIEKFDLFFFQKIFFHFLTTTNDGTEIDNSRKYSKPMEITLGHQFKLECWENCLKTMRLGEVAKFSVDKEVRISISLISFRFVFSSVTQRLSGRFKTNSRLLSKSKSRSSSSRWRRTQTTSLLWFYGVGTRPRTRWSR